MAGREGRGKAAGGQAGRPGYPAAVAQRRHPFPGPTARPTSSCESTHCPNSSGVDSSVSSARHEERTDYAVGTDEGKFDGDGTTTHS